MVTGSILFYSLTRSSAIADRPMRGDALYQLWCCTTVVWITHTDRIPTGGDPIGISPRSL